MTNRDNDVQRLQHFLNAVELEILRTSDEEILAGTDSRDEAKSIVQQTRNVVESAVLTHRREKRLAARRAYDADSTDEQTIAIPDDPESRRSLLLQLIQSGAYLPREMTLAFREGNAADMTDADIESTLQDLAVLGFLHNKSDDDE